MPVLTFVWTPQLSGSVSYPDLDLSQSKKFLIFH